MKKIDRYLKEVIKETKKINIPISTKIDREVKIKKRKTKSRFAICIKHKKDMKVSYTIEINKIILQCTVKEIKEILAHEVLHTCNGCFDHGLKWKKYARDMNNQYGYNIKRTTSFEELGLESPEEIIKYYVICTKCGQIIPRKNRCKLVTHTKNYRCKCGGELICKKAEEYK